MWSSIGDWLDQYYLGDEIYLFVLFTIMVVSGLAREHNLFGSTYGWLKTVLHSDRLVLALISLISGVLPIEGRSSVSAGILDTATAKGDRSGRGRWLLGPIDFLTTHHFYMWSPIEKPVILPMAAFGLSYTAWLGHIWPLMAVSAVWIGYYVFFALRDREINIEPQPNLGAAEFMRNVGPFLAAVIGYMLLGGEGPSAVFPVFGAMLAYYLTITGSWSWRKINGYVNWPTLALIGLIFLTSNYMQEHRAWLEDTVRGTGLDPHTVHGMFMISLLTFAASFSMGSDGKFAAITVLMTAVFGPEYLVWFFALDYAAYLLTPMHECVMIGKRYFGTPLSWYYAALGTWAALLLITAGLVTWG